MHTALDEAVLRLTSRIADQWQFLDRVPVQLVSLCSVRLMPLIAVLIYLWFRTGNLWFRPRSSRGSSCAPREIMISMRTVIEAIVAMLAAGAISCLLQILLPHRNRPYRSGDPAFVAPTGLIPDLAEQGSSLFCDHAAIVIALSTAVWLVSRPLGTLCYIWAALTTCLPRIYAGYHYTSDVLGGVLIGLAVAFCVRWRLPTATALMVSNRIALRQPASFQIGLFILLYQSAMVFDEIRLALR